ncbi:MULTISPECIES: cupin [Streptomyces]|uniref:Quercetin dioxygenase-like cupin family protein n=1 Tax=Streptomyces demainii TaxID=588122 RepID=A0ABT9KS51_9ACTN|nr:MULTISPECIES: cupin [Streptomyces]MBW8091297.1 cupin [Streptomyces hygroscopicus subsp. hygroscopicus]MCO8304819.1 cupin [Streptomyces sp. RKCA744]MDP9610251.1 quercetin dioxygenase-like cupin family protein [Streptomyces demainii]
MDDLTTLARRHLDQAKADPHGRSAHLFLHDGPLRQSVIAMVSGCELDEHNAPPAASLQVLHGHVRLTGGTNRMDLIAGQVQELPHERHGLRALEDSVVLLTTVTATPGCPTPYEEATTA